jgi:hypothetical protein
LCGSQKITNRNEQSKKEAKFTTFAITNSCIVWEAKTPQLILKGSEMHLSIALVLLPRGQVEEVILNLLPIIQL